MAYEDILNEVGGYGRFQVYFKYLFLSPMSMFVPWFWMNLIFMVSVPDHWCHVPPANFTNLTRIQLKSILTPSDTSCTMYDMDTETVLENGNDSLVKSMKITSCKYGMEYNNKDYDATASMKWDLVCEKKYYPSLILTLQKVGNLFGTPFFGFLSDKVGRKAVLLTVGIVTCVVEASSLFVENLYIFMFLKILNGSVLSAGISLAYILSVEFVTPAKRTHMTFIINCAWSIGICAIPVMAYLSRSWIVLGIVNTFSGALILAYHKYLPESPCWLVSQGRYTEAKDALKRIGDINGKNPDDAVLLKQVQDLGKDMEKQKEKEENSSFSILRYPRLGKHFVLLTFSWIASNVGYYGLIHNAKNLVGNEFLNFFLISLAEFPANVVFTFLMERIGRRWTNSGGLFLTGIICLVPISGLPYTDVISSMIGKFSTHGTLMVTDQQGPEIFPTVTRNFAMGGAKTAATAITLLLPYLADLTVYGRNLPFLVLSAVSLAASVMVSFLPETLNENLPQTVTEAEEFGKDQKYFPWKKKKSRSYTLSQTTTCMTIYQGS